jgi:hypothetical protein
MPFGLPASQFILADGTLIHFGQKLEDVERLLSISAVDRPLPIKREGVDKNIEARGLVLSFDTGRLNRIELQEPLHFKNPLTPYPEPWKNFPKIGGFQIHYGMSHEEFASYMTKWEERARSLGAESTEADDFEAHQFRFSFIREEFMLMHMFAMIMGPSRRARGGGIWADGWTAFFAMKADEKQGRAEGTLLSLSAFRDEFNSVARRPEWRMEESDD